MDPAAGRALELLRVSATPVWAAATAGIATTSELIRSLHVPSAGSAEILCHPWPAPPHFAPARAYRWYSRPRLCAWESVVLECSIPSTGLSTARSAKQSRGWRDIGFDPGTARFWHHERGSQWNLVLMTGYANLGLDQSHAHVQFNGTYHYHGLPTEMIKLAHGWAKVCLVGYAADGFPIYGPWGYRDPHNARSGVKKLAPSYRLRVGRRPGPPHGPGGHYDGKYTGDFEYVPGGGDLDKANGRYGVTPEYPGGTYYYVITETYPFIPRYFRGTPDRSFYKHLPRGGRRTGGGRGGFRPGGGGGGPGGFGPGGFGGGPPQ